MPGHFGELGVGAVEAAFGGLQALGQLGARGLHLLCEICAQGLQPAFQVAGLHVAQPSLQLAQRALQQVEGLAGAPHGAFEAGVQPGRQLVQRFGRHARRRLVPGFVQTADVGFQLRQPLDGAGLGALQTRGQRVDRLVIVGCGRCLRRRLFQALGPGVDLGQAFGGLGEALIGLGEALSGATSPS